MISFLTVTHSKEAKNVDCISVTVWTLNSMYPKASDLVLLCRCNRSLPYGHVPHTVSISSVYHKMTDCYWSDESFYSLIGYHWRSLEIHVIGAERRDQSVQYWNNYSQGRNRTSSPGQVNFIVQRFFLRDWVTKWMELILTYTDRCSSK